MKSKVRNKPVIAVTMGDPAGIGPEIASKSFANEQIKRICNPVLIGNAQLMKKALKLTSIKLTVHQINSISQARFDKDIINVYETGEENFVDIEWGKISAQAGRIAFKAVETAIMLALKGEVDATVTGPIHKESLNLAGYKFSGHTEIYAHLTHTRNYCMLLIDKHFRIAHVTTHLALREACNKVSRKKVLNTIFLLDNGLKRMGIKSPVIGVAGLNPHAGDGGLFGKEEINEIIPAIKEAADKGISVVGPVPPDTLFALAYGGRFDGCVAMYHDQGHIPFKLIGFKWDKKKGMMKSVEGVNITLGLPIIRTSVDHGTAFEIAGKGVANENAMIQAIKYAVKLSNPIKTL
jgi:4-hydroxythreonine-4-phosphate dehydrogenase